MGAAKWWLGGAAELVWPERVACRLCDAPEPAAALAPAAACLACAAHLFALPGHPCRRCSRPVPSQAAGPLCDECSSHAAYRGAAQGFDRAVAAGAYRGQVATWVRQLKYDGRVELAAPLGSLMAWAVQARLPWAAARRDAAGSMVVPVPLSPQRLAERGFNQAQLLAEALATALRLEMSTDLLQRTQAGSPQTSLGRQARLQALTGAFGVSAALESRGRLPGGQWDVLLVDDVLTTGATLDACAVALKKAGVARVFAAVTAAGIPQRLWDGRTGNPQPVHKLASYVAGKSLVIHQVHR